MKTALAVNAFAKHTNCLYWELLREGVLRSIKATKCGLPQHVLKLGSVSLKSVLTSKLR